MNRKLIDAAGWSALILVIAWGRSIPVAAVSLYRMANAQCSAGR